jgi:hypothetical protein
MKPNWFIDGEHSGTRGKRPLFMGESGSSNLKGEKERVLREQNEG